MWQIRIPKSRSHRASLYPPTGQSFRIVLHEVRRSYRPKAKDKAGELREYHWGMQDLPQVQDLLETGNRTESWEKSLQGHRASTTWSRAGLPSCRSLGTGPKTQSWQLATKQRETFHGSESWQQGFQTSLVSLVLRDPALMKVEILIPSQNIWSRWWTGSNWSCNKARNLLKYSFVSEPHIRGTINFSVGKYYLLQSLLIFYTQYPT